MEEDSYTQLNLQFCEINKTAKNDFSQNAVMENIIENIIFEIERHFILAIKKLIEKKYSLMQIEYYTNKQKCSLRFETEINYIIINSNPKHNYLYLLNVYVFEKQNNLQDCLDIRLLKYRVLPSNEIQDTMKILNILLGPLPDSLEKNRFYFQDGQDSCCFYLDENPCLYFLTQEELQDLECEVRRITLSFDKKVNFIKDSAYIVDSCTTIQSLKRKNSDT